MSAAHRGAFEKVFLPFTWLGALGAIVWFVSGSPLAEHEARTPAPRARGPHASAQSSARPSIAPPVRAAAKSRAGLTLALEQVEPRASLPALPLDASAVPKILRAIPAEPAPAAPAANAAQPKLR